MQTKIRWFDPKKPDHVVEEVVNGSPKVVKELYESMGKQIDVLETIDSEEMIIGPNGVSMPKSVMNEIIARENKTRLDALNAKATSVLKQQVDILKQEAGLLPKPGETKVTTNGATGGGAVSSNGATSSFMPPELVPTPESYVYFEEAGIKFRFNKNKNCMEKQDWIKIENEEMENYAVQSDRGTKITLLKDSKIKLLKKEWVQIQNGK